MSKFPPKLETPEESYDAMRQSWCEDVRGYWTKTVPLIVLGSIVVLLIALKVADTSRAVWAGVAILGFTMAILYPRPPSKADALLARKISARNAGVAEGAMAARVVPLNRQ